MSALSPVQCAFVIHSTQDSQLKTTDMLENVVEYFENKLNSENHRNQIICAQ